MSIMSRFPSKFLKVHDITPGEVVTIKSIADEPVGQDQVSKPVVYLVEYDRGIILNVTNAETLVKAFGDDESDWTGKRIVLSGIKVRKPGGGGMIDSICMEPAPSRSSKKGKTVAEEINDEVAF